MSAVDHPSHYQSGGMEAIDVIESFGLGFRLGNAVKYILRAGRKGPATEDLKKARWYLDREIAKRPATIPAPAIPAEVIHPSLAVAGRKSLRGFRNDAERVYIAAILNENDWNVSRTAAMLGLERTNLHKKMRSLGLSRIPAAAPAAAGTSDTQG